MTTLLLKQIGKGKWAAPQVQVEPDAKVLQGHFGRQTRLKAVQAMRTLPIQPERVV